MITEIITIGVSGSAIFIIWRFFKRKIDILESTVKESKSKLISAYVKFGKSFEHFTPFAKNFPGTLENTTFLGMPIDFISFEEDCIIFIEIKTGESQLSPKQKRIK
ncbi:hypothetical protein HN865_04750, partial [Candidatus Woesearchaeota archaeon]|nr:hypothetical protein [Candidatus Woesearchaeota archaeon]